MISAISQYFRIPMGMGLYYTFVFQNSVKPLFTKSQFLGEIGSSDMDDPFTQEEKIGYVAEEARKPNTNQKERERKPDNERERDYYDRDYTREASEREYQDLLDNKIDRLSGFDQYY